MGEHTRAKLCNAKLDRLNDHIGKLMSERTEVEAETRTLLAERSDARSTSLVDCAPDCDCWE